MNSNITSLVSVGFVYSTDIVPPQSSRANNFVAEVQGRKPGQSDW